MFKAPERSLLGTVYLGQLFRAASFPLGVVNLITGRAETGALIASHMAIRRLAYTGSINAGCASQLAAMQSDLKSVTLEVQGKSTAIIPNDAHLESAITHCLRMLTLDHIHVCLTTPHVLVYRSIADRLIAGISTAIAQLAVPIGAPSNPSTLLGPQVNKPYQERVQ